MLDYLLLATFIIVLSVTTVWFIRTIESFGKACYQAFLPSSKGDRIMRYTVLTRLSEKLEYLPMPWGWCPVEQQTVHTVQLKIAPVPVIIPWGWPGNLIPIRRHRSNKDAQRHQESDGHLANILQFPVPARQKVQPEEDLYLDIIGRQFGGFHHISVGNLAIKDVCLPWGW